MRHQYGGRRAPPCPGERAAPRETVTAVTSAVRRPTTWIIVGLLALLAGCGSGPSQVGAAAIVGDEALPIEQVQTQLDTALARLDREQRVLLAQNGQLDDVTSNIVTLAILHELLGEAARRQGISVNEEQVTDLIDELGGVEQASRGTVFAPEDFRERARDQLIAVELGRRALDNLAVTADYTTVTSRDDAFALTRRLAEDPGRARDRIGVERESGAAAMVDARLVAAENPELASSPAFGVPEGTVVTFPVDEAMSQWLVMLIRSRSTDARPAGNAAEPDPAVLEAVGIRQLAPIAADLGVRVNPRYGIWDPVSLSVVRDENELGGLALPVRQPAS